MGKIWELDFYSRPILDENDKKRWEVMICEGAESVADDPDSGLRYSQFLANTEVNSISLKAAISEVIDQVGAPPRAIRYFRYSMQNMIARACEELGIAARPSRRALTLQTWLDERKANYYPQQPGYTDKPAPTVAAPPPSPRSLPDALIGQQWAFVTLPAKDLKDMPEWSIDFSEAFPLTLADLDPEARIPGVLIFSPRALPLAGWMSGLELGHLRVEAAQPPRLILETGVADSWILATLANPKLQTEAQGFESAKQAANQVHFIGVQSSPEAENFAGFWLMQERNFG
ncbi:hypothetical protein C7271_07005 [filamentous cyanobacterium CCP5]|nr:hypothetical protein C7271_07005 [filamentous cyanobacterium CCP5]